MESEIRFKIKAFTEFNQCIKLIGSIPELGLWNPNQALSLYTNERDYPNWSNLHLLGIPCGQKFEFKFAIFEMNSLKSWEALPGNNNRKYSSRYARVSLVGTFGDIVGKEIIEKKYPSFSNIEITINEESIRKLRIGVHWDPLKYAENSESDDNSSFTEFFVTNSHSLSDDTVNNSEEDGLSDIVDTPEAALVIKPSKHVHSNQSSSSEADNRRENHKSSPKKMIKRNTHAYNKRPIVDKTMGSSLQRFFLRRKQENKLFHHSNCQETNPNNNALIKLTNISDKPQFAQFQEQSLLIISLHLPIRVKVSSSQNTTTYHDWEITIETRDFQSNLLNSLLSSKQRFLWLGILKTSEPIPFDKQESLKSLLLEKFHCVAVFYDFSELTKIKQEFFLNYFDYCLNFNLPRNSSKLFNYDDQLYLHYYKGQLLKVFMGEIQHICHQHPNPLMFLLDYQLFGLPNMIRNIYEKVSIVFYWGLSFLNDDNFTSLPFNHELLMSILSCNCLIFSTYQEAKPFFAILREKTGHDYSSNNGLLYIYHSGKSIAVRLASGLLDCEFLKKNNLEKGERLWDTYWKEALEGFELMVSIDDTDRNLALLFLKLKLVEALASLLLQDGNHRRLKFLEIYNSNVATNLSLFPVKNAMREINEKLGYECIYIIEGEIPESIENSLLSHTKILLETQVYETSICKVQRFLQLTKASGLIVVPASFEGWISSQTSCFLSFHHLSPNDFSKKLLSFLQSTSQSPVNPTKITKDSLTELTNPLIWLEEAFDDMLVSSNLKPNDELSHSFPSSNCYFEPVKLPSKRVPLTKLTQKSQTCKNKLLILGLEEVLIPKESFTFIKDEFDQSFKKILKKPSDLILESLQKIANNTPNLTVYILTGRALDLLGYWFMDLENIGFAHEYGFLNKDPGSRVWQRLFEMDWNWKDIVKKIMENYTVKTPGSILEMKEACVIWKFDHSDYELGLKQAEALIEHLNEVFENNSEIDVIKYDRAIEVRPLGLNKGTLVQMLMEKVIKEKGPLDLIVSVGGILSDEDVFNGIEESLMGNTKYLHEDGQVFNCVMGKKASNADYWIEGAEELIKILKALSE